MFSLVQSYNVKFDRVSGSLPVISNQDHTSTFKWNYNSAVSPSNNGGFGLVVRCQDQENPNDPYSVTPSKLAYVELQGPLNLNNITFTNLTADSVVLEPDGPEEAYGTEDPRIVYRERTGEYFMLYSAVQAQPSVIPRLALAVSKTPQVKGSWKRYGPLFPQEKNSKSGAMLIRDGFPGPHYLFFGDSSLYPGLQTATSTDLLHWDIQPQLLLQTRKNYFDSALVEAGPMPLPLSDGNYLFIYNSARHGFPSIKPGWDLQYNVGWVILDKDDPTKILQRSDEPILSPELGWEKGDAPYLGLTPNVVFLEGWIPLPSQNNTFLAFYGGADSVMGAGIITVTT
uniref:Glycosyl hydrolase family 32 N-terminal domain-containing protein n=1 Tax=Arcella intermedia TaxID=1963864 RepID=A0A6B2L8N7_9EUKA